MQEAGATATLEMAFTIADGIEYCRSDLLVHALVPSETHSGRINLFSPPPPAPFLIIHSYLPPC
jgi:methylmalonyl-CoA mutase N-terminal domain/subunit